MESKELSTIKSLLEEVHEAQRMEYFEALGQREKPCNLSILWDELMQTKSYMSAFDGYCCDDYPKQRDVFCDKIIGYTKEKARSFDIIYEDEF